MPTISIKRDELFQNLGRSFADDEFDDLCFQYGLELDEIITERQLAIRDGENPPKDVDHVVFKIEIPANRFDLLCLEGLSQALRVFLSRNGKSCQTTMMLVAPNFVVNTSVDRRVFMYRRNSRKVSGDGSNTAIPEYQLNTLAFKENQPAGSPPVVKQQIKVEPATYAIRPFVVGAVLRNITFTPSSYASFIELQDKLHQNLCRKRTLAAIGTHDLDTIQGPFFYDALPPENIRFKALNQSKVYNAVELMALYSTDSHLRHYLHIVKDSPVYPVIKDKNGVVLSMPPIINGDHSKITLKTKNVFIEITATDLTKASVVLDTVVTMFSVHCEPKFVVEEVDVEYADGVQTYPKLLYRTMTVSTDEINKKVGINVDALTIKNLLERMSLSARIEPGLKDNIVVRIPPTRHDILHPCDLVEEVAIAYGFDNIEMRMPGAALIGDQLAVNRVTDLLRREIVGAGYTEALTFALCSRDDIADKLRQKIENIPAVHIANPKTLEFQVVRTTLIPGILKTIASNKNMPLPLRIFEISDVVVKDSSKDVGSRNTRRLCAVYYGKSAEIGPIHGLLNRLMQLLNVPYRKADDGYYTVAHSDPAFFDGTCAQVIALGKPVGVFGMLHPESHSHFDLVNICSVLEVDIEFFI